MSTLHCLAESCPVHAVTAACRPAYHPQVHAQAVGNFPLAQEACILLFALGLSSALLKGLLSAVLSFLIC